MSYRNALKAAALVRDAGGRVVGRTRLQKIAYLLSLTGLEEGFFFTYKHYGPFSEDLATAARDAGLLKLLSEKEQQTTWGGIYSIYESVQPTSTNTDAARRHLAIVAAEADAIELELAATAVYLWHEGYREPWLETTRRKPEKAANGRIERARVLYSKLSAIRTPKPLPSI